MLGLFNTRPHCIIIPFSRGDVGVATAGVAREALRVFQDTQLGL